MRIALVLVLALVACAVPAPSPPVVPDAMTDGGCGLADKVSAARLIRNPDGNALVIPCDGGAP